MPLSIQLLGSGGLEVSSTVVASLSLLLSKAALLRRQEALLLQSPQTSRFEHLLLQLLQVLLKRVSFFSSRTQLWRPVPLRLIKRRLPSVVGDPVGV